MVQIQNLDPNGFDEELVSGKCALANGLYEKLLTQMSKQHPTKQIS